MATQFTDYFNNSSMAQASYQTFKNGMTEQEYKDALKDNNKFSDSQATQFAEEFTVLNQQKNTSTGFSATVFQDKSDQKTLALRGTEPDLFTMVDDLFSTDVGDIFGDGIAIKQGIDLFNYIQQQRAAKNSPYRQYVLIDGGILGYKIESYEVTAEQRDIDKGINQQNTPIDLISNINDMPQRGVQPC